jgi:hypothetical protein
VRPPFGYEFALRYCGKQALNDWHAELFARGWLAGVVLPDEQGVLFAVTEQRSREQMDALLQEVRDLG